MVEACVKAQGLELEATVLGTAYPFPDIICESFGHCSKNAFIDEVSEGGEASEAGGKGGEMDGKWMGGTRW